MQASTVGRPSARRRCEAVCGVGSLAARVAMPIHSAMMLLGEIATGARHPGRDDVEDDPMRLNHSPFPLVPAKAGTQFLALDSRFRGNERRAVQRPWIES